MSVEYHCPDSAADVRSTTNDGDALDGFHHVVFRRVRVQVKLDGGCVGELDGANSNTL